MEDRKLDAAARAFLAVKLHNYYSALEKMLVRIMRTLDGTVPSGDSWHRELIEQACRPAPGIRPAIIDHGLAAELDRLRSFRHFFRNAYVVELDWAELECHRQRVSSLHPRLISSIEQLLEHLEASCDFVENHQT
ncbi:MAG: hypothetical protein D6806_03720 [Deltaproteobacteria bacterium]|nr:MAG: hypothetical protein D6806_03720 [Deltaproteobacteria bacterium]